MKRAVLPALLLAFLSRRGFVPLVDEREQPREGVVQVCAFDGTRAGQFDVELEDERLYFILEPTDGIRPGGLREQAYFHLWRALRPWPAERRR